MRSFALSLLFVFSITAADMPATAERGKAVLQEQNCTKCHAIAGTSLTVSTSALQRPLAREYTPAGLVATLWNHAPKMWSAMSASNTPVPKISEQDAAHIFTYFASLRYFEPMGDAGRGGKTLQTKGCTECHVNGADSLAAPAAKWESASDPVALVSAMWNHIPRMSEEMAKRKQKWPELTSHDLSDIVLYARSFPANRNQSIRLELPPPEGGDALVEQHGCRNCHTGHLEFGKQMGNRTLTDVAASMWNHGSQMLRSPAPISPEEMRTLLGTVWSRQFVMPSGDPVKGRKVAESKKCVACHESGPGPGFAKLQGKFTVLRLTSALWAHGPAMLAQMREKKIEWPRLTAADVENLIGYIDSGKGKAVRAAR